MSGLVDRRNAGVRQTIAYLLVLWMAMTLAWLPRAMQAQSGDGWGDADQLHMVHMTPHLLVLDHNTRMATLTFGNQGNTPVEADIIPQYGFTVWRDQDTVLFHPVGRAPEGMEDAYDTVIVNPGPKEHYAGRWLSGVPAHLKLGPHESRSITLRIDPPPQLATGEYYVRLVAVSHPPHPKGGKSMDVKAHNVLPVVGKAPMLRDSTRIYYRQGPQTLRVTFPLAKAAIDTTRAGEDFAEIHSLGRNPLRLLLQFHLAGTAHFEGFSNDFIVTPTGKRIVMGWAEGGNGFASRVSFVLQRDAVIRWLTQTSMLTPGHYTYVVQLISDMSEFPPERRLRMDTVQAVIPFDIP